MNKNIKPKSKPDFNNTLENVNIKNYKSNKSNIYKYSLEELQKIADKHHWIHEFDLEEFEEETKDKHSPLDIKIEEEIDYKKLYFELLEKQNKQEIKKEKEIIKPEIKDNDENEDLKRLEAELAALEDQIDEPIKPIKIKKIKKDKK